jgi:hypothetical protein
MSSRGTTRKENEVSEEVKGTFCGVVPGDRKGRDGVNPSSTHLRLVRGDMYRRGDRAMLYPRDPCGCCLRAVRRLV